MYSNLPKEFQEIARRLARQDRELKKSESDLRGRSNSRKSSRMTSRASSLSPTRDTKPRSRSKSNDTENNMEMFTFEKVCYALYLLSDILRFGCLTQTRIRILAYFTLDYFEDSTLKFFFAVIKFQVKLFDVAILCFCQLEIHLRMLSRTRLMFCPL